MRHSFHAAHGRLKVLGVHLITGQQRGSGQRLQEGKHGDWEFDGGAVATAEPLVAAVAASQRGSWSSLQRHPRRAQRPFMGVGHGAQWSALPKRSLPYRAVINAFNSERVKACGRDGRGRWRRRCNKQDSWNWRKRPSLRCSRPLQRDEAAGKTNTSDGGRRSVRPACGSQCGQCDAAQSELGGGGVGRPKYRSDRFASKESPARADTGWTADAWLMCALKDGAMVGVAAKPPPPRAA